jgi:hypothetical protein
VLRQRYMRQTSRGCETCSMTSRAHCLLTPQCGERRWPGRCPAKNRLRCLDPPRGPQATPADDDTGAQPAWQPSAASVPEARPMAANVEEEPPAATGAAREANPAHCARRPAAPRHLQSRQLCTCTRKWRANARQHGHLGAPHASRRRRTRVHSTSLTAGAEQRTRLCASLERRSKVDLVRAGERVERCTGALTNIRGGDECGRGKPWAGVVCGSQAQLGTTYVRWKICSRMGP